MRDESTVRRETMGVFTTLRNTSMRTKAIIATALAVAIVPAAVLAWGPSRATFTEQSPATYVTFNSITNNSFYGDERNFVTIKDAANTANGGWSDNLTVEQGKEYVVRMYVHNNAADNLNLVAENVRASASVPTTTGKSVSISGFVNSSNANPTQVWDDVTLNAGQDFNLAYVPGSATFHNNSVGKAPQGVALPDSIVTSAGALLGYDKLDGKIPGCYQYSGYVYFKVKPQFATPTTDFSISKQVRKDGATDGFKESTAVNPGDTVNYRVEVKNTGTAALNNIVLKDQLPQGVSFVPGSAKILNGNNQSGAVLAGGDNIVTSGVNIGSYAAGTNAFVVFNAKVADNAQLPTCGPITLTNTASAQPEGQNPKSDTADVTTKKDCEEVKKIEVCDLTTKKIVTIDEKDFDSTKHSKNLNDCKEVPATIQVCNLADNKIITINEKDFDSKKHSKNLADCEQKTIQVCDLNSKTIVTIDSKNFDSKKHSTNLADCKMCPLPGMNNIPANSPNCVNNPVTTLPQTGIDGGLGIFAGIGLLTAGLGYALSSSRIRSLLIG